MMEASRRVTAAAAQLPQLLMLGAHSCNLEPGAFNVMNCQEYPIRITMFALSASMSPALKHKNFRQVYALVTQDQDNTKRNFKRHRISEE